MKAECADTFMQLTSRSVSGVLEVGWFLGTCAHRAFVRLSSAGFRDGQRKMKA